MKLGINTTTIEKLVGKELDAGNIHEMINPLKYVEQSIKLGIRNFEISCDINFMYGDDLNSQIVSGLADLKKEHLLTYSVHLPFRGVEISYPSMEMSNAYVKLMAKVIETMEPVQPEAYVIHVFGELGKKFGKHGKEAYVIKYLSGFSSYVLKKILEETKIPSRKIAVENVKFPFDIMQDTIEELDLSVCMDVGHILAGYSGEFTVRAFMDKYYNRIAEIHLHDAYNRPTPEGVSIKDHIALGEGDLDYPWLIKELQERSYHKRIILEMKPDAAISSFARLNAEFSGIWE